MFLFSSSYIDGNFLAIGSHDNYIYIYAVAENGRKYSRVGKCSVSTCIYNPPLILYFKFLSASPLSLAPSSVLHFSAFWMCVYRKPAKS